MKYEIDQKEFVELNYETVISASIDFLMIIHDIHDDMNDGISSRIVLIKNDLEQLIKDLRKQQKGGAE